MGPRAAGFALIVAVIAGFFAIANFAELVKLSSQLFVPDTASIGGFFAWLFLKVVHELGHAVIAIHVGGAVRQAGLSLFCFTPIPYVDVSDVWRTNDRRARILCSLEA